MRQAAIWVGAVNSRRANYAMPLVGHLGAFGDNEPSRCPMNIVFADEVGRDVILGCTGPRHRRHENSIGKFQTVKIEGFEEVSHLS